MRTTTTLLFTFIFAVAFGQNSDTTGLSADTTATALAASTTLDSTALWALDDRLAKLDAEHVFRTAAQIKAIDTTLSRICHQREIARQQVRRSILSKPIIS